MDGLQEPKGSSRRSIGLFIVGFLLIVSLMCLILLVINQILVPQSNYSIGQIFQVTAGPTQSPEASIAEQRETRNELTPTEPSPAASVQTDWIEVAYVIKAIDGDTIEIFMDGKSQRLRYIGINSPEAGEKGAAEATAINRALTEGKIVSLEGDVSDKDKYGRLLRYVYLEDGTFVNAQLVKLGAALAVPYPPDTKFQVQLFKAQEEAQVSGIGLWAIPEIEPTISDDDEGSVTIDADCSQFNAPGDDNENKNQEFVCFVNYSSRPINMTGWELSDNYGWTYVFPEFTLSDSSTVKVRSGCGSDSREDLFWCRIETAVWNNGGDCVHLMDHLRQLQVEYCY